MRKHVCLKIKTALALSDAELDKIGLNFFEDGQPISDKKQIRKSLADALEDGDIYIPNVECDHFDPKIGCLGHRD